MLTEASAAVSLPYINNEHQKIYVWFLVIFPSLLITLFFLTLNFNNKSLYTPADLSKVEPSSTINSYLTGPALENIPTFKNIAVPQDTSSLTCQPGLKLNAYSPKNFIFLPQGHRTYDPDTIKPAAKSNKTKTSPVQKHVLIEGAELKSLHFFDLTVASLQRAHKLTPKDVLHSYYKSTRKHKNNGSRPDVLFLLANRQSDALLEALRYSLDNSKNPQPSLVTTLIIYHTDTQQLEISS